MCYLEWVGCVLGYKNYFRIFPYDKNKKFDEENEKLTPLRDKKMESLAKLQKINLDITNLEKEETPLELNEEVPAEEDNKSE